MEGQRPAIVRVTQKEDDDDAHVAVTLAFGETEFLGTAAGPSDPIIRPRLIGEATLRAVESLLDGRVRLNLAAIATQDLGPLRVALAQVQVPGEGESLVGSAVIPEDDPAIATVRAVLDAVNRRITRLLT